MAGGNYGGKGLYLGLNRLYADLQALLVCGPPAWLRAQIRVCAENELRGLLEKSYKSKEVKRFVGKVQNGFGHWFTFISVPGVEATNNRAEHAAQRARGVA